MLRYHTSEAAGQTAGCRGYPLVRNLDKNLLVSQQIVERSQLRLDANTKTSADSQVLSEKVL